MQIWLYANRCASLNLLLLVGPSSHHTVVAIATAIASEECIAIILKAMGQYPSPLLLHAASGALERLAPIAPRRLFTAGAVRGLRAAMHAGASGPAFAALCALAEAPPEDFNLEEHRNCLAAIVEEMQCKDAMFHVHERGCKALGRLATEWLGLEEIQVQEVFATVMRSMAAHHHRWCVVYSGWWALATMLFRWSSSPDLKQSSSPSLQAGVTPHGVSDLYACPKGDFNLLRTPYSDRSPSCGAILDTTEVQQQQQQQGQRWQQLEQGQQQQRPQQIRHRTSPPPPSSQLQQQTQQKGAKATARDEEVAIPIPKPCRLDVPSNSLLECVIKVLSEHMPNMVVAEAACHLVEVLLLGTEASATVPLPGILMLLQSILGEANESTSSTPLLFEPSASQCSGGPSQRRRPSGYWIAVMQSIGATDVARHGMAVVMMAMEYHAQLHCSGIKALIALARIPSMGQMVISPAASTLTTPHICGIVKPPTAQALPGSCEYHEQTSSIHRHVSACR